MQRFKNLILVVLLALIPTILVWLPFLFRLPNFWTIPLPTDGMATIVANYDGPLYIVVAKTLYNSSLIQSSFSFPLPVEYYASHFPLYPLLIRLLSPIAGFPYSMLAVTVISSIAAMYFFYKFILDVSDKKTAISLLLVFSFFPARWLIVRSVGSPEPLFIAAIIASIFYFKKEKYLLAGIWGAIAQATKSPGALLFISYAIFIIISFIKSLAGIKTRKTSFNFLKYTPLLLIPLTLLVVFFGYSLSLNDFLAYFHSGDNIHLSFPPFQIFNYSASWVGTFWLEEIIFIYLLGGITVVKLLKSELDIVAIFALVFFGSLLFVSHRDLMRYSLPLIPFALLAFSETIKSKEFKYVLAVLFIPIYLFSLAYISQNVMPISDWAPFL